MSRTYRRNTGDQSHHYYILRRWEGHYRQPHLDVEVSRTRELRLWHSDNGWVMSVPGWFNNQQCTRPLRVKTRQMVAKAMRASDLEDVDFVNKVHRPWYW